MKYKDETLAIDEPDFKRWRDPATGLRCVIVRQRAGHLCGYVEVPSGKLRDKLTRFQKIPRGKTHFGRNRRTVRRSKAYDHKLLRQIVVHGGLTFSGRMHRGFGENRFWLGFDCAHYQDICPLFPITFRLPGAVYRNFAYVTQQASDLAKQIKALNACFEAQKADQREKREVEAAVRALTEAHLAQYRLKAAITI